MTYAMNKDGVAGAVTTTDEPGGSDVAMVDDNAPWSESLDDISGLRAALPSQGDDDDTHGDSGDDIVFTDAIPMLPQPPRAAPRCAANDAPRSADAPGTIAAVVSAEADVIHKARTANDAPRSADAPDTIEAVVVCADVDVVHEVHAFRDESGRKHLNGYIKVHHLGRGAFSSVKLYRRSASEQDASVKLYRRSTSSEQDFIASGPQLHMPNGACTVEQIGSDNSLAPDQQHQHQFQQQQQQQQQQCRAKSVSTVVTAKANVPAELLHVSTTSHSGATGPALSSAAAAAATAAVGTTIYNNRAENNNNNDNDERNNNNDDNNSNNNNTDPNNNNNNNNNDNNNNNTDPNNNNNNNNNDNNNNSNNNNADHSNNNDNDNNNNNNNHNPNGLVAFKVFNRLLLSRMREYKSKPNGGGMTSVSALDRVAKELELWSQLKQ
jgi:hypothetical protein